MLSFGIRFGQGFDKVNIIKLMQSISTEIQYDFVVVGCNPGGVACAREAKAAGMKTALIHWKRYSPAEEEGYDEDLQKMAEVLEVKEDIFPGYNQKNLSWNVYQNDESDPRMKNRKSVSFEKVSLDINRLGTEDLESSKETKKYKRKVRQSRLDLNNELFKRGKQCRKLMRNATVLGDVVESAQNSGWRLSSTFPPLTINWHKMSEEIMDYVMKENWALLAALSEENIEIIEGEPTLINNYTVKVTKSDKTEINITSAIICIALPAECILPEDVPGAERFGITCDDFIRMNELPGKTLVVGSLPESLECAGILANCKLPVTVVCRSQILKGYDSEITQMIMDDLKKKGVVFLENTTLLSIKQTHSEKLMASFITPELSEGSLEKSVEEIQELFDTILLATGRKVHTENLNLKAVGVEEEANHKIKTDLNDETTVPNIYAVGDVVSGCPVDFEISELAGKILGRRLFQKGTEFMDYNMVPSVIYTPTEYAFVGISEESALYRLGLQCVEVYYGHFTPLDFALPPKKGQCFAKIIVYKQNDGIIGLHIYGPEAGEMIQGFAAAIRNGLTMSSFRTLIGVTGTKVQEVLKIKEIRTVKPQEAIILYD